MEAGWRAVFCGLYWKTTHIVYNETDLFYRLQNSNCDIFLAIWPQAKHLMSLNLISKKEIIHL